MGQPTQGWWKPTCGGGYAVVREVDGPPGVRPEACHLRVSVQKTPDRMNETCGTLSDDDAANVPRDNAGRCSIRTLNSVGAFPNGRRPLRRRPATTDTVRQLRPTPQTCRLANLLCWSLHQRADPIGELVSHWEGGQHESVLRCFLAGRLLAGAALVVTSACRSPQEPVPPTPVASVTVTSGELSVLAPAPFRIEATAFDADERPIPHAAFIWTSSDPAVVEVQPVGLLPGAAVLRGVAAGSAVVSATSGGVTAEAEVNVIARVEGPFEIVHLGPMANVGAINDRGEVVICAPGGDVILWRRVRRFPWGSSEGAGSGPQKPAGPTDWNSATRPRSSSSRGVGLMAESCTVSALRTCG
jgi:hypothetical protein